MVQTTGTGIEPMFAELLATRGVLVTYAAPDGNRYTARHTIAAITSAGDVALESK